jgi:hypothetical protein
MRRTGICTAAGLLIALSSGPALCQSVVDGVVGLHPAGERSCLAQEILVPDGQALTGLRFYNNDGTRAFPQLLLLEASAAASPNLQDAGVVLADVSAQSLSWGDIALGAPVISSTGAVFAVFVLPPNAERVGEGTAGGPGIGFVRQKAGPRAFVSADGLEWLPVHPAYRLAVEPVFQARTGFATALSSLVRSGSGGGIAVVEPEKPAPVLVTHLLAPRPNPFNPRTEIRFELALQGAVDIVVYDLRGHRVQRLTSGPWPQGSHEVTWLGTDQAGRPVASGVYLVRMEALGQTWTQRVALVR